MRNLYLAILIILSALKGMGQTDAAGSGRALQFDGIDDYVDLGNVYDDLALPFSVSVWVYIDPSTTTTGPVMVTQDNNPLYNGFWFIISASNIGIEYGDGKGENHPAYRRGKSAGTPNIKGHWTHICAVMKGASDVDLYVNGVNVGGNYGGLSTYPMASDYPDDVAKVGYFFSNGIIYRFRGLMDELRLYSRALSESEIRSTMCHRLEGNEAGLIGYWNFDEVDGNTLYDQSPKGFHGQLKGNPERVYSGAPVGNESVHVYADTWTGVVLSKESGPEKVEAYNIDGTKGIHIYEVTSLPSRHGGMDISKITPPYFGVFATDQHADYSYEMDYTTSGELVCEFYSRTDNAEPVWSVKQVPAIESDRMEVIKYKGSANPGLQAELGPDLLLCDADSKVLSGNIDPSGKDFFWSTGERTPSIVVDTSGEYVLEVTQECQMARDTVSVVFRDSPVAFSLGEDQISCEFEPRLLEVQHPVEGFEFTWHDNSSDIAFQAEDFGLYWLKISNECGSFSDSVRFDRVELSESDMPNIITPNGDLKNQYFMVHPILAGSKLLVFNRWGKQVYASYNYRNDWDGDDLPSGVYYYTISGECLKAGKGVIHIIR